MSTEPERTPAEIVAAHQSNGHRLCYAPSLGPITVKHSNSYVQPKVLRCSNDLGHEGPHKDAVCCWNFHEFSVEMAGPPDPDHHVTEACVECHTKWPCDVARIAPYVREES